MRRDMDLVRTMLLGVADSLGPLDCSAFVDERHDFATVGDHVQLMVEAGLVEATLFREMNGMVVRARIDRMTWAGNDFLDAISNETIWKKVKLRVAQTAGSVTFEVMKAMAVAEVQSCLLAPTTP